METEQNVGGRDRLVRLALTVVLSIVAVRWFKRGKRLRGLLAGAGALGFGFNATTGYCGVNDTLDIDTTAGESVTDAVGISLDDDAADATETTGAVTPDASGDAKLTCAACGDLIVPGQSRGPNDDDDIVHDDCR